MVTTLDQKGIEKLFEFRIKAGLTLEYVSAQKISSLEDKQALFFSQIISAMANANGGLIFIGIHATRKLPRTLQAISTKNAVTWLQTICKTHISPEIPNILIASIPVSEQGDFVIGISVPNSYKAPHIAGDKRFYKRVDNKTQLMEEFEIRDLYQKSKRPEIEVYAILNTNGIPHMENGKFAQMNFYPRFLLKNTSSTIEKFFKVEISIPSQIHNPNFDSLQNHFNRFDDGDTIFTILHNVPLYQNEIATVAEGHFIVDAQSFKAFEDGELIMKVFYSSGVQTRCFNLKETFLYKNKQLDVHDFLQEQSILGTKESNTPRLF